MGDHMFLSVVNPLHIAPSSLLIPQQGSFFGGATTHVINIGKCDTPKEEKGKYEGKKPIQMLECRICQEEDTLQNLDIPCACNGTLKFAHPKCVQLWCFEKGDTICEICLQPFRLGYTATSPFYYPEHTSIDIRENWPASSISLDLHDPRLLAIAALEHQVLETRHEDHVYTGINGTTLCRVAALIFMTLLLLRHAGPFFNAKMEKTLAYFSFFFLRAAVIILPCYFVARIIRIIHHQRQRQQAAAGLAFMRQAGEQQD